MTNKTSNRNFVTPFLLVFVRADIKFYPHTHENTFLSYKPNTYRVYPR